MKNEVSEALLDEVKEYLQVTWHDEDSRIRRDIQRAMTNLQTIISPALTFADDDGKQLLLDCCRYIRNNSYEYFQQNFLEEIQSLQWKEAIKERVNDAKSNT
ncbi:hypothetical protein BMT55_11635 [Listeria newyorkensis]|uniref:Phage gp6-like head-tail connector protein n=1 Tax=Listeria newyorkensis TaxID=1497681 RepID=A0ABX4XL56_9LIST|nr:hypothetical protein [Listeria newyorkensis]PNP90624.1 hypothetical protein BMT55_11635 [Listeria newyorkensis]